MPISKIKPISRAFFKLIEIYNDHNIFVSDAPITSFHLAEGPGGFIEATTYIRNNTQDTYYGMTLIDPNNNNIPGWKKAEYLMKKYPNINIEYGADNEGNLYNHCNLEYCKNLKSYDCAKFDKEVNLKAEEILPMITWGTSPQDVITIDGKITNPQNEKNEDKKNS